MANPAAEVPPLMLTNNPILNKPYREPGRHYAPDWQGNLGCDRVEPGRRRFVPGVAVVPGWRVAGRVIRQLGEESTRVISD